MPPSPRRRVKTRDQRGTVLVVTVVAMLILGILAVSFAALGNLEVRIGLNDVWEKQAALIAEGGIAAVRNQIQNPPDYTAFLDGRVYSCTTSACSCSTGCPTDSLATMSTGEFSVRIDNDPDELAGVSPAVDANKRVVLTALGITRGAGGNVMGRARLRAWLTNDDPWKHVCSSSDGTLCTDPPNNQNAEVIPPDPNHPNGPRTYPQIPVPNNIRTVPCEGCALNVAAPNYPVPTGVAALIPGSATGPACPPVAPQPALQCRGPAVMYPYYLTALTTPCTQCSVGTQTIAYDPANPICTNPATAAQCLGMVRVDESLSLQSNSGGSGAKLILPGGALGTAGTGVTLYVMGKIDIKSGINLIYGTLVFHGGGDAGTGGAQTDLHFQGPHTVTTVAPACSTCSYPLAILGYNPNEPLPWIAPTPGQRMYLDISNNGVIMNGSIYTGGTVDFGPNSVNGSVLGYAVHANNAATEFTYYTPPEPPLPPPGFSTPAVTLPSVIARGTWLQCRTADNLTAACD